MQLDEQCVMVNYLWQMPSDSGISPKKPSGQLVHPIKMLFSLYALVAVESFCRTGLCTCTVRKRALRLCTKGAPSDIIHWVFMTKNKLIRYFVEALHQCTPSNLFWSGTENRNSLFRQYFTGLIPLKQQVKGLRSSPLVTIKIS